MSALQSAWTTDIAIFLACVGIAVVMGLWIRYGRGDDGVEYPLQRLTYRKATARRIDPGVDAALEVFEKEGCDSSWV
jgi:hypothetical protein